MVRLLYRKVCRTDDLLMETRHFIKTLCTQKVETFFLSTLIALNPKWVPRFSGLIGLIMSKRGLFSEELIP